MGKKRLVIVVGMVLAMLLLSFQHIAHATSEIYIARPFRSYYQQHQGSRLLGLPLTGLIQNNGYTVQYFEKGRLEDHSSSATAPGWSVMYGRLTVELMENVPQTYISGTSMTYGLLEEHSQQLVPPPEGMTLGPVPMDDGMFVPFDPHMNATYGYIVPTAFWEHMNNTEFHPGGWLPSIGLPITNAFSVEVFKDGVYRPVTMQAFERAILTHDPQNEPGWEIERVNVGGDVVRVTGIPTLKTGGPKRIEISLSQQWLYAFEGDQMIFDAPVSTGRNGFDTPTGYFSVYRKVPLQRMQGELNGESWDVPNVPHAMYFYGGDAIHGTYWHNSFGTGLRLSHGCVNLPMTDAAILYEWTPIGTPVHVYW
jgi:hypothetical protein